MHTEIFQWIATTEADAGLAGTGPAGAGQFTMIGLTLLILAALGAVLLIVAALVQISQAVHLRESARTRWVLSVVFAPVFGAIAWFAVGNRPLIG
jgi:hypothetical protein